MDPVRTHSSADHVDNVSGGRGFVVRFSSVRKCARHQSYCSAVNEWFSEISVIKDNRAIDGWNSRFVSTRSNPSVHASENTRWVEEPFRYVARVVRWTEAEYVGICDWAGA